jgi:phospholipid transport system transporter-binding protein
MNAFNAFQLLDRGDGEYAVQGDLTFATASEALKATAPLFGSGRALRFDLKGVGRADSAGVALLIEWVRRAERSGAGLRYAHLPQPLLAIIRVSGVGEFLPADPAGT